MARAATAVNLAKRTRFNWRWPFHPEPVADHSAVAQLPAAPHGDAPLAGRPGQLLQGGVPLGCNVGWSEAHIRYQVLPLVHQHVGAAARPRFFASLGPGSVVDRWVSWLRRSLIDDNRSRRGIASNQI